MTTVTGKKVVLAQVPKEEITVVYRDYEDHRGEYDLVDVVSSHYSDIMDILHIVYDGKLYDVEDVFITLVSYDEFSYTLTLDEILMSLISDLEDNPLTEIDQVDIMLELDEDEYESLQGNNDRLENMGMLSESGEVKE